MVYRGKILPAADIVSPVGNARSREIKARGYLAFERVPGGVDIPGPEDGSVPLRPEVGIARKNERALFEVTADAFINRGRMEQRIDIEIARAGSDEKVTAVCGQIRLRFVRPKGVKAFADQMVTDHIPIPAAGFRIRSIDVGSNAVIRQTVGRRAVRQVFEPSFA